MLLISQLLASPQEGMISVIVPIRLELSCAKALAWVSLNVSVEFSGIAFTLWLGNNGMDPATLSNGDIWLLLLKVTTSWPPSLKLSVVLLRYYLWPDLDLDLLPLLPIFMPNSCSRYWAFSCRRLMRYAYWICLSLISFSFFSTERDLPLGPAPTL